MADVELRITADLDQATKEVSGFRKEYSDMVKAVEKPLRQIDALQKTQESAKAAAAEFYATRKRVDGLQDALSKVRAPADALAKSLGEARKQADAAGASIDRQKKRIDEQRLSVDKAKASYTALKAAMAVGGADKESVDRSRKALDEQVASLRKQQTALRDQRKELAATAAGIKQMEAAYEQAAQPVRLIEKDLRGAERALDGATREFDRQKNQVRQQRDELRRAGVDTGNLAKEQKRLQSELQKSVGAGRNEQAARGIRERAAALKQQAVAQRQANIEAARENLGVSRYRALQTEIQSATQQYELLRRSGKLTARELAVAQQQLTQRIRESKNELKALASEQGATGGGSGGIVAGAGARLGVAGGAAAGVAAAAYLAAQYAAAVDPIKKMEAQLKLATESQEEFAKAQAETFRIAQENQAPLEDVVTLYSRLTPALREVGRGQGDAIKIIEAVTKSLRISGATAQETASTIQQFSQALGSGVLRGEEFNTLAESSPRLLKALADGLKVNVGDLRDMAAAGELTADVISGALIGQLPKLTEEAAKLPDTFSGAMVRMKNEMQQFLKEFDSFTGASDAVIGIVNRLAGGFGDLADAIKRVKSGEFSDFFRDDKQTAAGINNEISVLLSKIRDLQNARNRLDKKDPDDTVLFKFKFYSKEELDAELKALQDHITKLKELRTGLAGDEKQSHGYRSGLFAMHAAEMKALRQSELKDLEESLDKQVQATKTKLSEQVKAERAAASELESAKKAQLENQQRYQEALAKVNGGTAGDPSYASATALKVSARNALQAGDVEGAKRQAQAALAVIEQLAEAGENTFGFGGFIKELQAIQKAADQKGVDEAQAKLDKAKQTADQTRLALEALKKIEVKASMSPEDQQKLLDDLAKLAKQAGIILTVPVTPVMPQGGEPDYSQPYTLKDPGPAPQGFATGGYTGPGGKYEPAGVVHRGEVVWSQLDIARAGGVAVVEAMRRGMRGYSMGGIVAAPRLMPSIPAISPSLMQQADPMSGLKDYGKATIATSGGDYEVLIRKDSFARLLQREADRVGSKKRR